MKLTLRTLLAWRDGLLSAEDTREIGSRVEASLTARLMAGRIDAVTSRDVVMQHAGSKTSPVATQGRAGFSVAELSTCNDIAEYIANRLPVERMPSFEKECLQSERLLCEVAGCHRLIAELERDSSLVAEAEPQEIGKMLEAVRSMILSRSKAARIPKTETRVDVDDSQPSRAGHDYSPTDAGVHGAEGSHSGSERADVYASSASDRSGTHATVRSDRTTGGDAWRAWGVAVAALLFAAALMVALAFVLWRPRTTGQGRELATRAQADSEIPAAVTGSQHAQNPDPDGDETADFETNQLESKQIDERVAVDSRESSVQSDHPEEDRAEPMATSSGTNPGDRGVDTDPPASQASTDDQSTTVAASPEAIAAMDTESPDVAVTRTSPVAGPDSDREPPRTRPVPGGNAMAIAATDAPGRGPAGGGLAGASQRASIADADPTRIEQDSDQKGSAVVGSGEGVGTFSGMPLILVRSDVELPGNDEAANPLTAASDGWRVPGEQEPIHAGDELLVPGFFLTGISLGGCDLRLYPMARVRIGQPSAEGIPAIELLEGRAAVISTVNGLHVRIGGLEGRLTVAPGSVVGMEIKRGLSEGAHAVGKSDEGNFTDQVTIVGRLWFPAGGRWSPLGEPLPQFVPVPVNDPDAIQERLSITDGSVAVGTILEWVNTNADVVRFGSIDPASDWVESPAPLERLDRSAAEELRARVAAVSPVQRAMRELSVDRKVENRVAAAEALAAMGEFDVMVELLNADGTAKGLSPTQWRSLFERAMLPALARGPEEMQSLRAALEDRLPAGDAALVYACAVGFSDEALEGGAAEELVTALDHPELGVRRIASWRLEQIVNPKATERVRYRAERSQSLRADGVRWWRQQLEKGLIRRSAAGGLSRG